MLRLRSGLVFVAAIWVLSLSVSAARANFVWVVGASGTIRHSTNGGSTWRTQTSPTGQTLNAVDFVDYGYGWAVGNSGTIVRTVNGGQTWTTQSSGTTQPLYAVDFVDRNNGYAVGGGSTLLKTTNGGATWTKKTAGYNSDIYAVDFQSSSLGWITGGPGNPNLNVSKTTNGTTDWTHNWISGTSGYYLNDMDFADGNNGWTAGFAGYVYRTTNGGTNWSGQQLKYLGVGYTIEAVDFVESTTTGVAVTDTDAWRTTDGATWTRAWVGTYDYLRDVVMLNTTTGWTVGNGGEVYKTTNGGASWSRQYPGTTAALYGVASIYSPGQTAANAFTPTAPQNPDKSFSFQNCPGDGFWFDPPANSYLYQTDGNSAFTQVQLPSLTAVPDADGQYQITSSLGTVTVNANQTYTFPSPVTSFTITGIDPMVDGDNSQAFPVLLKFNQNSVSFTMTPIPEPSTLALAALGLAGWAAFHWRRARIAR